MYSIKNKTLLGNKNSLDLCGVTGKQQQGLKWWQTGSVRQYIPSYTTTYIHRHQHLFIYGQMQQHLYTLVRTAFIFLIGSFIFLFKSSVRKTSSSYPNQSLSHSTIKTHRSYSGETGRGGEHRSHETSWTLPQLRLWQRYDDTTPCNS